MTNFLDKHSQEKLLRAAFPEFDNFTPEEREEIRRIWMYQNRHSSHCKLHELIDGDCNYCGQAFHSQVEIAEARKD